MHMTSPTLKPFHGTELPHLFLCIVRVLDFHLQRSACAILAVPLFVHFSTQFSVNIACKGCLPYATTPSTHKSFLDFLWNICKTSTTVHRIPSDKLPYVSHTQPAFWRLLENQTKARKLSLSGYMAYVMTPKYQIAFFTFFIHFPETIKTRP